MIVHLHPNNCTQPKKVGGTAIPPQLEVTLLRRDRSLPCSETCAIPHPLDRKNVPEKPDYQLTEPWVPTK
ncbi:hypothetical protein RISK_005210 [Rhodopirellula islandica]|uniref:Uncharacterized protein n=2 Tax=Rhodopirellula islandica TaxID=595434 RepID=A0A0J1EBI2_RHOIS|nr:hypothetical protein RISK_005210 [Rhodopirellula islandica]